MSNKFKRIIGLIACLACCLCFVACNGSGIKISGKNRVTIQAGQTYEITATGTTGSGTEWTSSDETVATVANGKVTAIKAGETVITVKEGNKSASVTVVVVDNRSYTVTVVGVDTYKVGYGEKIAKPADPVKAATAQYAYTFKGWYSDGKPYDFNQGVTANLVIEPVFDKTLNKYKVTVGSTELEYEYGSQIVLTGELANPVMESTAKNIYVFIGYYNGETKWDFANDVVTGDVVLTAKYQEILRQYEVSFNGKSAGFYDYDSKLTEPEAPAKAANAQFTYTFKGWYVGDKKWNFAADTVTEKTELVAKYDEKVNSYTVKAGDKEQTLDYGAKITAPETPVKESTAKYDYVFAGWMTEDGTAWDFANDTVTGNVTLTASFTSVIRKYDFTVPAHTVLDGGEYKQVAASTVKVAYGEKVARPATPAQEGKDGKTYYFDKYVVKGTETEWNFDKDVVEGDVELEILFKERTGKYLVDFDGKYFKEYEYGQKIVRPEDPTKASDLLNDYIFQYWANGEKEWDFDNDVITADMTLTAVFGATDRLYEIKFIVNGEENENLTQEVRIGKKIEKPEGTPVKASTKTKTYEFTGWYNGAEEWNFDNVLAGPVTLTAHFEEKVRLYTVTFDADNGTESATVECEYGARIKAPADPADIVNKELGKKFVFIGWTKGDELWDFITGSVTENVTLKAKYEEKEIYYTVTYLDENGALLFTHQAKDAEAIIRLAAHEKATDARYAYTFIGWTANGTTEYDFTAELEADLVLSPMYLEVARIYTVTLLNYDGTVFKVLEGENGFKYGEKFTYALDAEQPIKEIGDENSYVFDYWAIKGSNDEFKGEVIGNMVLYPVFIIDNNLYTVKYYDYDGNLIEAATQSDVKRNKLLTLPDMTKAATLERKYTFLGWATEKDGAIRYAAENTQIRCTGNMEMYSVYKTEIIYYTVSARVTDEDNTYWLTDKEGNRLTADDLSFEYGKKFEFKLSVNTESMGKASVKLNGGEMIADENGVYSVTVRDNNNRITITGLTIRRYTVTGAVTVAKQNDVNPMIAGEDDVIVKLTDGEDVQYVENAVKNGVVTVENLLKGDYTVEFVAKDSEGGYKSISEAKYTQALNADWAEKNGNMTWKLAGSLVGYTPVTVSGKYEMNENGVIHNTVEEMRNSLGATVIGANPGESDFIVSASYDVKKRADDEDHRDGPSFGFTFKTRSGDYISVYVVDEGRIRIVDTITGWDNRIQTGKLVVGAGAIGNVWGDCYGMVTMTYAKKDGKLYLFGSFSDKTNAVIKVNNKLLGVIDTATGTLYTAKVMSGSSSDSFNNPLYETDEYQTYQKDVLKKLSDVTAISAEYGITQIAPVDVYGINYSALATDVEEYASKAYTRVVTELDNHASLMVKNPTGNKTTVNVWDTATFTVMPDPGYVIKTVEFDTAEQYPYYFNEKGYLVFSFPKNFYRGGNYNVKITTEKGSAANWTKLSGKFTTEGAVETKAAAVLFGNNGITVTVTPDENGEYMTLLPVGSYYASANTAPVSAGAAYETLDKPRTYRYDFNLTVNGSALVKNIDFALMTGGTVITDRKTSTVEWSGNSDATFSMSVKSFGEKQYFLARKLAAGQMISYSLKFGARQGWTALEGGANEALAQDLYIKNSVGGKNLGISSYGQSWSGTKISSKSPFNSISLNLAKNETGNVYNFAYARLGNTVYLLAKYEGAENWVAVSKTDVTDAQAQIMLYISGAQRYFDYTYSNFGFNKNESEVKAIVDAAVANKANAKTYDFGSKNEKGEYNAFIGADMLGKEVKGDRAAGYVISDQTFSKTTDTVTITANVGTYMQGYQFFGFVMRDPKTGNMVNIGINENSNVWRTSLENYNGWGYRSGVMPKLWDTSWVDIGGGNSAAVGATFTVKAVVKGDFWTIYLNGSQQISLDLRRYYEDNFVGGGATATGAASGNAKHGWTGDTEKLYPIGDEYQLGFYAFADTTCMARVNNVKVTKTASEGELLFENSLVEGLESVKNAKDIEYTMYRAQGNGRGFKSARVADGEALTFTLRLNQASGNRRAHQQRVTGTNVDGGDTYYKFKFAGKSLGFNSNGCAYGEGVVNANTFDFGLARDGWGLSLFSETQYDFAIAKVNGTAKMYGKYHGASEWKEIFSIANTAKYVYLDNFEITNRGDCAVNMSFINAERAKASDITSHMNNVSHGGAWAFGSANYNADGTMGFYAHVTTAGQRGQGAYYNPNAIYNAKDNTVVLTGNYSMLNGGSNETQFGWNFIDSAAAGKNLYFSIVPYHGNGSQLRIGWDSFRNNGWGRRYTLGNTSYKDEAKGLYAYNPASLTLGDKTLKQFSAKWVINGYRYKLYFGEYGAEATTLVLDIDMQKYSSAVVPQGGNDNTKWGGSDAASADKHIPDMKSFRFAISVVDDTQKVEDEDKKDITDMTLTKSVMTAENMTAREVWTGGDVSLTGPAYKLVTDENGNRITSDYWYAEADFDGSVAGSGWAGIITDMMGASSLQTATRDKATPFYGTGYGYGQIYIHRNGHWLGGTPYGCSVGNKAVKIASARMGNKVNVYLDGVLKMSYAVTDKPSQFGIFAGAGVIDDMTAKNFKYVVGKEATEKKMAEIAGTVTKKIDGKDYTLLTADLGGKFDYADGTSYNSFNANYTMQGRNALTMTNITFAYQTAYTGNVYYMEAEFDMASNYQGIIVNTYNKPEANNQYFLAVGFGYGDKNFTNLYMHTTQGWGYDGLHIGKFALDGDDIVRMGVARIGDMYYVFLDGKYVTKFYAPCIDTATKNTLPGDNESGFGVFNCRPTDNATKVTNAFFTMNENDVRAMVANAEKNTVGRVSSLVSSKYVLSGKMTIDKPTGGNHYVDFTVVNGANRFLLWDGDNNGSYEFAYTINNQHIHRGNLPASEYVNLTNGKVTFDWEIIHDGKNAYFIIDGKVRLVFANLGAGEGTVQIWADGCTMKIDDMKCYTSADTEEYAKALESVAYYANTLKGDAKFMYRVGTDNGLEVSCNGTGSVINDGINPFTNGTADNYVYETTLVIEQVGGNAHYGIEFPDSDHRFLFWNNGDGNTFKITWAYDGGYGDAKYQRPATAGTYKMKVVVKGGNAYWFVDGTLMCAIKAQGALAVRIESMKAHTEGTKIISKTYNEAAYNAAIEGLNLPAITGATRF